MRDYHYDHVHLRSPDPDATAWFFETMFGAGSLGSARSVPSFQSASSSWSAT